VIRGTVLLAAAAAAAACGGPPPAGRDLAVRLEIDRAEVGVGEPFAIAVVRTFDRDLEPAPFDPASLAPLRARAEGVGSVSEGRRTVETLRFTAVATAAGEIRVAAPRIEARPREGGAARAAAGAGLGIRAVARLDPLRPGVPELPVGLPAAAGRGPWGVLAAVAAAAAFAAAWLLRGGGRGRRGLEATAAAAVVNPVEARAARTVRALRALEASAGADDGAFHDALIGILRADLAARGVPLAAASTTEELLGSAAVAASLGRVGMENLRILLLRSDRVRFADAAGTAAERTRMLSASSGVAESSP
jgi:hypothetical protein